ncbi:ABC transporter substrate-binding protein [Aerococcaceae bacterium DSM 109653]|uniref:ABC transporter substrate-binding protein n=1 Tax=Fundicoccus ignavus TaxID=2664442 RepID=A0A844BHR8_9LACT|nr:ABC transporter substrate-binding protein [Fundicoccus ignavus]MRI80544.1 ABC transporter substrate-binding protein [Fundicoccus ignavus]
MKKFKNVLLTGLVVAGSVLAPMSVSAQEATGEPLVLGVNLELTGPAAPYSVPAVEAFELYVEQVNATGGVLDGRPLELVVLDNKTDTTEGVSLQTRLNDDPEVVATLGPNASGVVNAAKPVIESSAKPTVLPATTGDGLTLAANGEAVANLFRTAYEDSYQGTAGAVYVYDTLGAQNTLLIVDNALDYSQGLADAFVTKYEELGGTVVATEAYSSGDTDFTALATKLLGYEFDAIYMPGYYTETGLLVKAFRELGLTQPVVGADGYASDTFVELAGAENTYDVHYTTHYDASLESEASVAFGEAYTEKFGKAPDTFAALGYDAISFLVDGIERAGSTDPEAISQALAETVDFEGVTGTFSINDEHNPVKPAVMVTLDNGNVVNAQEVVVD